MDARRDVEVALGAKADLGEAPTWDAAARLLIWVDITRGRRAPIRSTDGTGRGAASVFVVRDSTPDTTAEETIARRAVDRL